MLRIYHNPRCRKSREGLDYLKSKTDKFEIIEYLKDGLNIEQIKEIVLKTSLKPFELVRVEEEIYKKELKGRNFTDEEWITILSENPKLLKRPVIVGKHKAVLAQPAQEIDKIKF